MQISAFRGNRTVTSLRLCSRAPWTTSSSTAISGTFYRANGRSYSGLPLPPAGRFRAPLFGENASMSDTARKSFIATLVAVLVIAGALALWHLKVLVALLLLALVISSAIRPGVEMLQRHRIPRPVGVLIHYVAFLAVIAFLLWLIVPRALDQVEGAIGTVPTSAQDVAKAAKHSHGIKHEILIGL